MGVKSVQVSSLDTERNDHSEAAVTLIDDPRGVHIWLENADGDCGHVFTEAQFNELVGQVRALKGWA